MDSLIRSRRPSRSRRQAAALEALEPRVLLSYTFTSIASFQNATTGAQPEGLVMDAAGNLYGVTAFGGPKLYGTVFKIAAGTNTITTLASFTGLNGMSPKGNLLLDAHGDLFGTTTGGGAYGDGTIFEVAAGTASTITTLASFNGANGAFPFAGLVADAHGDLFGTTMGGGNNTRYASTVFELAAGSGTITTLATFKYTDQLTGTLAINSAGTIFGTTGLGGVHADGSVFQIAGTGHTLTTLASFNGTSGSDPDGALLLDAQGNLKGLTAGGGANGDGTIFQVPATSSATIMTLASFNGTNGQRPIGTLVVDGGGNLFGVTALGGSKSGGTVFERAAGTSNTITSLFSFTSSTTGSNPTGPLALDSQGNLWGETYLGGPKNNGTVFELHNNSVVFAPAPVPAGLQAAAAPVLRLVVTQQPASVASGKQFVLVITLEDAQGNVVKSNAKLTLSLTSGPQGGAFGGTHSLSFVNGVARFSNLVLKGKGAFTIGAASGTLAEAYASPIVVK